jgi:hypothetical protein
MHWRGRALAGFGRGAGVRDDDCSDENGEHVRPRVFGFGEDTSEGELEDEREGEREGETEGGTLKLRPNGLPSALRLLPAGSLGDRTTPWPSRGRDGDDDRAINSCAFGDEVEFYVGVLEERLLLCRGHHSCRVGVPRSVRCDRDEGELERPNGGRSGKG